MYVYDEMFRDQVIICLNLDIVTIAGIYVWELPRADRVFATSTVTDSRLLHET